MAFLPARELPHPLWKGIKTHCRGWFPAIPERNQKVEWLFFPVYVFQQNRTGPLVASPSLRKFADDKQLSESDLSKLNRGVLSDVNGWEIIKKRQIPKSVKEVPVQVIELEPRGHKGMDKYQKMLNSKKSGYYLRHEKGHTAYLPFERKGMYKAFINAVKPFTKMNVDVTSQSDIHDMTNRLYSGREVDGWKLDQSVLPTSVEVTTPTGDEYGYSLKHGERNGAFENIMKFVPDDKRISKEIFNRLVNGKNPPYAIAQGWSVSNPESSDQGIIIWKAQ